MWLCVYVCVTLHALVYGAAQRLLGACVPEPGPVCLSPASCWTRNSNMNYWLIIRLPILFAIGVSDAVGRRWELWWARALREDGVARAF